MHAQGVDPRDVTWEDEQPVYRVYFWGRSKAPDNVPPEHVGYYCREYRVSDADDIHEVIAWADQATVGDETYTLYVERQESGETGLIRLAGTDPTGGN